MSDLLVQQLRAAIGASAILAEDADMAPYLTDWRGRYAGRARCVARPATTTELAEVVRLCVAAAAPIVPQGGNTGLCGGATPDPSGDAVVVSTTRMNRVRGIDADNFTATVEAGCTLAQVQEAAARADRLFPLSLASEGSCSIGGNLSTNAGGVHVLRYGNTRDLTLGLEVVLPDGRIWDGLRGLRKDNTGYDLKHLFIGAEGTLGIVTAAVLKLFPMPRSRAVAWVAIAAPEDAVALLSMVRGSCGDRLCAFELVGKNALDLVLAHIPGARMPLAEAAPWNVLVELADPHPDAPLQEQLASVLQQAMDRRCVTDAVLARDIAQEQALWKLRESVSEAQKIEGFSIKHDIAVPLSCIPAFLHRADARLRDDYPGVRIVAFGHVGDGNLHYNLSFAGSDENQRLLDATPVINRIVHDLVDALGGSFSAEHGIGQLKRAELLRYKSEVEIALMRAVKQALDPRQLMNPGRVL